MPLERVDEPRRVGVLERFVPDLRVEVDFRELDEDFRELVVVR